MTLEASFRHLFFQKYLPNTYQLLSLVQLGDAVRNQSDKDSALIFVPFVIVSFLECQGAC